MTKTKLEIIGPYTPDHEGPFCTRDGMPARVICIDRIGCEYPIIALVMIGDAERFFSYTSNGIHSKLHLCENDLMNAREVPVAREFWVNEYTGGMISGPHVSADIAYEARKNAKSYIRTIHVREVLPGDE